MKKKINKKLLARIGAVLACILLVGALAIPVFADVTEADKEEARYYRDLLFELYNLDFRDPLYHMLGDGTPYHLIDTEPLLYQFHFAGYGDILDSQIQFLTYGYTQHFGDWDDTYLFNRDTDMVYSLGQGYWSTNYTTSGDNRFFYLKYFTYRYDDGTSSEMLRIRFKIDKNTLRIGEVTVELKGPYNLSLPYDNLSIASVGSRKYNAPIDYCISSGLLNVEVAVDYQEFKKAVDFGALDGYDKGSQDGYTDGYEEGYNSGYTIGSEDGYNDGFHSGYTQGSSDGYWQGYDEGEEAGQKIGYQNGYDAGLVSSDAYSEAYQQAISEIDTGKFGENFLGNMFSAPIKAVQGITLVHLPNGGSITLGHVMSALIALLLVLAFVKIYSR